MSEVRVFRCCTDDDGTYLGSPFIHDPDLPGDGPWYLAVIDPDDDARRTEYGFATRDQALSKLATLIADGLAATTTTIDEPYPDGI